MQTNRIVRAGLSGIVLLAVVFGVGRLVGAGQNLYINGTLASSRVIQFGGAAYVPIADVAKSMGMAVAQRSDGYAIAPAGGAGQVNGIAGKIGDKLTNGQFVLTVVSVKRTDIYAKQFDSGDARSDNPNDDLVVVLLRVKNAYPRSISFPVYGGGHTNLTDQDEHSYTAGRFSSDYRAVDPDMLPGSATDWALVFNVPKTEKLKDLVFQIAATCPSANLKETDFRIDVSGVNP